MQAPLAQLTWYHHITLLDKVKDDKERQFYMRKTVENGWSRNIMVAQISTDLFNRQGKAITNFENILPASDSDLAKETLKSPYVFDFLTLSEEAKEKDLEKALIQHLKKFMLELGKGFAYVGNQYNLEVGNDDYFLDLLFYNTHLHCYVIFELKIGEFKPEFAGKLNFYINTVNEQIKTIEDKPTIGVLLCKTANETVIKYSLKGMETPMGIAEYTLASALPKELKGEIPTIEELEKELEAEAERLEKPVDKKMNLLKELIKGLNQEEMIEKKSDEKTMEIFHLVLLPLYHAISDELKKEIASYFSGFRAMIRTGSYGNAKIEDALEYLSKHPNEYDLGLEFNLYGFKPAGVKAFECSADIRIYLHNFKYAIMNDRNNHVNALEKLYHQLPTDEEMSYIVDKTKEEILDKINEQLERIKKETNE